MKKILVVDDHEHMDIILSELIKKYLKGSTKIIKAKEVGDFNDSNLIIIAHTPAEERFVLDKFSEFELDVIFQEIRSQSSYNYPWKEAVNKAKKVVLMTNWEIKEEEYQSIENVLYSKKTEIFRKIENFINLPIIIKQNDYNEEKFLKKAFKGFLPVFSRKVSC